MCGHQESYHIHPRAPLCASWRHDDTPNPLSGDEAALKTGAFPDATARGGGGPDIVIVLVDAVSRTQFNARLPLTAAWMAAMERQSAARYDAFRSRMKPVEEGVAGGARDGIDAKQDTRTRDARSRDGRSGSGRVEGPVSQLPSLGKFPPLGSRFLVNEWMRFHSVGGHTSPNMMAMMGGEPDEVSEALYEGRHTSLLAMHRMFAKKHSRPEPNTRYIPADVQVLDPQPAWQAIQKSRYDALHWEGSGRTKRANELRGPARHAVNYSVGWLYGRLQENGDTRYHTAHVATYCDDDINHWWNVERLGTIFAPPLWVSSSGRASRNASSLEVRDDADEARNCSGCTLPSTVMHPTPLHTSNRNATAASDAGDGSSVRYVGYEVHPCSKPLSWCAAPATTTEPVKPPSGPLPARCADGSGGPAHSADSDLFIPFCHTEFEAPGQHGNNFKGPYGVASRCIARRSVAQHGMGYLRELLGIHATLPKSLPCCQMESSARSIRRRWETRVDDAHRRASASEDPSQPHSNRKALPHFHKRIAAFLHLFEGHEGTMEVIHTLDRPLVSFLQAMKSTGQLDHTAVFVMGDHGNHMGPYPYMNSAGHAEERLPFMFTLLPARIRGQLLPYSTLLRNENRLATPFDVYQTLVHLSTFPKPPPYVKGYGDSLLTELLHNRTCVDAAIPAETCLCNRHR